MPAHGRVRCCAEQLRRRRGEGGFSLVELLVVLLIVAVIVAIAAPQVLSTRQRSTAPLINAGAGAIWRGVSHYRIENHGMLPPASLLANGGRDFVNPGGGRYVERWPTDGSGSGPMVVTASNASTPPTSVPASPGGTVLYRGAANSATGWLAAYTPQGKQVYRRVIATSVADTRPVG